MGLPSLAPSSTVVVLVAWSQPDRSTNILSFSSPAILPTLTPPLLQPQQPLSSFLFTTNLQLLTALPFIYLTLRSPNTFYLYAQFLLLLSLILGRHPHSGFPLLCLDPANGHSSSTSAAQPHSPNNPLGPSQPSRCRITIARSSSIISHCPQPIPHHRIITMVAGQGGLPACPIRRTRIASSVGFGA